MLAQWDLKACGGVLPASGVSDCLSAHCAKDPVGDMHIGLPPAAEGTCCV